MNQDRKIIVGTNYEYIDNLLNDIKKIIIEMTDSEFDPTVIITIEKI